MFGLRNVWRTIAAARGPGQDFGVSKQTKSEVNDVSVNSSLVKTDRQRTNVIGKGQDYTQMTDNEDQSSSRPVEESPSYSIAAS